MGQARAAVELGDLRHVFVGQAHGRRFKGGRQVVALGRRRNDREALLQRPGQRNLRRGGLVAAGNGLDHRVLPHFAIGQAHVGGTDGSPPGWWRSPRHRRSRSPCGSARW
ncbi:hypothetical protein G6F32_015508 [Rhizopus arrhizus]|nr:hypothetical protein G6F32_015508 [Rhizopus arrhizus]